MLLDVRTPEEYCAGHLVGAKLVPTRHPPLSSFDQDTLEMNLLICLRFVKRNEPIFVYCKKGIRAKQAQQLIRSFGFTNVFSLGGVMDEPLASIFRTANPQLVKSCNFGQTSTVFNIHDFALENKQFRHVVATPGRQQIVVMSLLPGEEIGMEQHPEVDQFIRVESGFGLATVKSATKLFQVPLTVGDALVIRHGDWHNLVNTDKLWPLKLSTIYSPPSHSHGLIQRDRL